MWFFAGLLIGAVIGSIGGVDNAVFGAIAGGIAGALVGSALKRTLGGDNDRFADLEFKIGHIYKSLEDVHQRLVRLEEPQLQEARPSAAPVASTEPTSTPVSQVQTAAAPSDIEGARAVDAGAPVSAAALSAAVDAAGETPAGAPNAPAPKQPAEPNPIVKWLLGGNTLVRVGMIVLFFGVAFLLKYAAERELVPIELRLVAVAGGGIALLLVGWRLRLRRPGYALMLQGGAVGVLYLTVFAALRLYHLLPAGLAFAVLFGIAASSAALAVLQNSRSLAITGVIGGFLAPLLASTGGGDHVALFSFYAVLDAGILGIAYYKAWRELNLIGFAFTFVIGILWGTERYRPELFASTEPFLILFFVFYVAIAVLYALRQAPRLAHYVDGTLIFGTPLIAFGLQTALVRDMEFGAAWSAFALAAFYLVLATVLHARKRQSLVLLVESFLALGIGFATLAVPLAFDGRWTSAVWAVEGAAILWTGVRQGRLLARVFGMLLQLAAGAAFLIDTGAPSGATPVLNSLYLGCVMISFAALFCSRYVELNAAQVRPEERSAAAVLFVWGVLWWFVAGFVEIDRHAPTAWGEVHAELLFSAASCGLFGLLWQHGWKGARLVTLALLPLSAALAVSSAMPVAAHPHPFAHHAYVGWAFALAVHLWTLRRHEGYGGPVIEWWHAAGFWLLAVLLSWEIGWQIDHYVEGRRVWPLIAWALVPAVLIATFAAYGERLGWPVDRHRYAYLYAGALPLTVFLLGWIIYSGFANDGDPAPLPYVPLLNPLDLAQAGALLAVATWYVALRRLASPLARLPAEADAIKVLGGVLFVLLNGVLLRTLHHYANVPFNLHAMLHSVLVQASLSLFWTILALVAMIMATRRRLRALWVVGAVLLCVVVGKLFLVDLENSGTAERWISFIGVGVLVIVIGYFAPVPPRSQEGSV